MTNYYNDTYKTYRNEPITKRMSRVFRKYFVVDAGQLLIGGIGLIFIIGGF